MPKSDRPVGRRSAKTKAPRTPDEDGPQGNLSPARLTPDTRPLIARILDTPHLGQVVPRLQPEVLHRVIQSSGLEDCSELITLATPRQLARVFDLDLWRAEQPGMDEQFDADRFGLWLEVLLEAGASVAARKLAEMDVDLVIAGVAQHALVADLAAVSGGVAPDGEEMVADGALSNGLSREIGGYLVVARRNDSWDALVAVLGALEEEHSERFNRVMRGCRSLSNGARELDELDDLLSDQDQVMFDLSVGREQRREQQGYLTPAQARAFLQMARQLPVGPGTEPSGNPVAQAYFRAVDWTAGSGVSSESKGLALESAAAPSVGDSRDAMAAVVELLVDAGVLTQPRALLGAPQGQEPRLALMRSLMQFAHEHDEAAYSLRSQELAYLANAILAGCSIQGRPFTLQEASDAAVAACNLGLENWPSEWRTAGQLPGRAVVEGGAALPEGFLVDHDLVNVFQAGWTTLYEGVSMYTAERLTAILAQFQCADRDIQDGLDILRTELARSRQTGTPWRARDALEVIAILDMPAWAGLLGLIGECPVLHAAIGASRTARTLTVSATAFEFISENSQIASIRKFMESLAETLRR